MHSKEHSLEKAQRINTEYYIQIAKLRINGIKLIVEFADDILRASFRIGIAEGAFKNLLFDTLDNAPEFLATMKTNVNEITNSDKDDDFPEKLELTNEAFTTILYLDSIGTPESNFWKNYDYFQGLHEKLGVRNRDLSAIACVNRNSALLYSYRRLDQKISFVDTLLSFGNKISNICLTAISSLIASSNRSVQLDLPSSVIFPAEIIEIIYFKITDITPNDIKSYKDMIGASKVDFLKKA